MGSMGSARPANAACSLASNTHPPYTTHTHTHREALEDATREKAQLEAEIAAM